MRKQISIDFVRTLHEFRQCGEELFEGYKVNDLRKLFKFNPSLFLLYFRPAIFEISTLDFVEHRTLELDSVFVKIGLVGLAELTNFCDQTYLRPLVLLLSHEVLCQEVMSFAHVLYEH